MLADCTLYLITNLLISYMVFVCDIQKLQVASHLLFSSTVRVQLSHAYRTVDEMS